MDNLRLFTQNKWDNNESLTKTKKRQRLGRKRKLTHAFDELALSPCQSQNHFSFLISLLYNRKLPLIDLSQGSTIFNVWQEWKRGCDGQKYNVYKGLYCSLTTCQELSRQNIFTKTKKPFSRQKVYKTERKLWVFKMNFSTFIQYVICAIVKTVV